MRYALEEFPDREITTLHVVAVPGNWSAFEKSLEDFSGYEHQIVIGSHGRHGASRVLFGSVAEAVTRRSNVPVVVVP